MTSPMLTDKGRLLSIPPDLTLPSEDELDWLRVVQRGGPGSGHHGHKGRPGKVGGSLPSGKGMQDVAVITEATETIERYGGNWDHSDALNFDRLPSVVNAEKKLAYNYIDREIEHLYILDSFGRSVLSKDGTRTGVKVSLDEGLDIKDAGRSAMSDGTIGLHNHPNVRRPGGEIGGSTLSLADIEFAIETRQSEIRAVSSNGIFIMRFSPSFHEGRWLAGELTNDPETGATVTTGKLAPRRFAIESIERNMRDAQPYGLEALRDRADAHHRAWMALAGEFPQWFEYEVRQPR